MPRSAYSHAGRGAARVVGSRVVWARIIGALALGLAACLASAPAASAATYYVSGTARGASLDVVPAGQTQYVFDSSPELAAPYRSTVTPPQSDTSAGLDDPGLLSTGPLSADLSGPPPGGAIEADASASDVTVPDGILTADTVQSRCTAQQSGATGSATFTNLVIEGVAMPDDPAPNTTVGLPDGDVTLNEQKTSNNGTENFYEAAAYIKLQPGSALGQGYILIGDVDCAAADPTTIGMPVGAVGGVLLTGALGLVFAVRLLGRRTAVRRTTAGA